MYNVFIAEDEIWIRNEIMEMIDRSGEPFRVVGEASNGEEAWSFIEELWPTVLITDIMMPKKDGLWLIEQIAEKQLPIISIIISGYDNFKYAQKAIHFGVSEYLLKPVDEKPLIQALTKSIKRLQRYKELHKFLLKIQDFIEGMPNKDAQRLMREHSHLLDSIMHMKEMNPGARKSLISVYADKLNLLIEGIFPNHEKKFLESDDEQWIRRYFQNLLELWLEHYTHFSSNNQRYLIKKACEYIAVHYTKELTLKHMAEVVYMSSSYFSTLFKQYTGQNFVNYLNHMRIEKAKQYLMEPEMKIYEVAEKTGYLTLQYFNRVFKNIVGVTPNEYRKRMGL